MSKRVTILSIVLFLFLIFDGILLLKVINLSFTSKTPHENFSLKRRNKFVLTDFTGKTFGFGVEKSEDFNKDEQRWWVTALISDKPYLKDGYYFLPLKDATLLLAKAGNKLGVSVAPQCKIPEPQPWTTEKVETVVKKIKPKTQIRFQLTTGVSKEYVEKTKKKKVCQAECRERIKLSQKYFPNNRAFIQAEQEGKDFRGIIGPVGQMIICVF